MVGDAWLRVLQEGEHTEESSPVGRGVQVGQESRCVSGVSHPAGVGRREEGEEVMPAKKSAPKPAPPGTTRRRYTPADLKPGTTPSRRPQFTPTKGGGGRGVMRTGSGKLIGTLASEDSPIRPIKPRRSKPV